MIIYEYIITNWFIISLLLLVIEIFHGCGYFLLISITAAITGTLNYFLKSLTWVYCTFIFMILILLIFIILLYYGKFYIDKNKLCTCKKKLLNKRGHNLIGYCLTLSEPVINRVGRITIGDGSWRIETLPDVQNLPAGTLVEIISIKSITYIIRPCNNFLKEKKYVK